MTLRGLITQMSAALMGRWRSSEGPQETPWSTSSERVTSMVESTEQALEPLDKNVPLVPPTLTCLRCRRPCQLPETSPTLFPPLGRKTPDGGGVCDLCVTSEVYDQLYEGDTTVRLRVSFGGDQLLTLLGGSPVAKITHRRGRHWTAVTPRGVTLYGIGGQGEETNVRRHRRQPVQVRRLIG